MSDRSKKLLTPLSKSEQGLLNCVNTSKEAKNELIISMFLSEYTKNEDSHA